MTRWLICSCCGRGLKDTAAENANFRNKIASLDTGFGYCRRCYGDPKSKDPRERVGWANCLTYDPLVKKMAESLNAENRARFEAMEYDLQVAFVNMALAEGVMTLSWGEIKRNV